MKKIYILMLLLLCISSINYQTSATTFTIQATAANQFTPSTVNALVGDTIHFQWVGGFHNTTCDNTGVTFLPAGAIPWAPQPLNSTITSFEYILQVAGQYHYECTFHPGMEGDINVTIPIPDSALVTFIVDLSQDTICAGSPHIAGSFNGWSTTANPLDSIGNGIYQKTLLLAVDTAYEYKFLNDTILGSPCGDETVPAACNVNGNRQVIVPVNDTVLSMVCFGSCSACIVVPLPDSALVTFIVDLSLDTVCAGSPHIAGSFNGWSTTANPLDSIGNGIYQKTLLLAVDTAYEYKFLNDTILGSPCGDETVPAACNVNGNRQVIVPVNDTVLPMVCFGSCSACIVVPLPDSALVTFIVDLSLDTVCAGSPHIAGSFNGWSTTANPLDSIGNGIYQKTLLLAVDTAYEYKFLNDTILGSPCGDEIVPAACNVNGNRQVIVPVNDTVLPRVCFGSCSACPVLVGVTFKVDMSQTTLGPGGPHVTGSFNGFDPAANKLSLVGAIYRKKIFIQAGDTIQYLFLKDSTFNGQESVPSSCGVPDSIGGFYRQIVVPFTDTIMDIVCYSSCTVCSPTPKVNVTFNVDMSQTLLGPGGPHYAGTYNGFFANVTPMTHIGNNIYTVTLPLDTGHYEEYTFLKDSTYNGQEIISSACGVPNGTGGFNRFVTTQQTNMILPPFCYGSCSVCTVGMNDHDDADIISVYPNPTENILYIETAAAHNNLQLKLLSMDGKLLFDKQVNPVYQQTISIDMNSFAKGVYVLKVESTKGTSVQKVILK